MLLPAEFEMKIFLLIGNRGKVELDLYGQLGAKRRGAQSEGGEEEKKEKRRKEKGEKGKAGMNSILI
jgi:hypothetical protein